jgi:carbon-monoxide dehydrogenase medium subunit
LKSPAFDYVRPASLDEVFALLDDESRDGRILAGGQSLMAALNFRLDAPELMIDINRIDGLAGVSEENDRIRIGALTRHVEIEHSEIVARDLPLLSRAIRDVAHAAIRNRGTFGGSLALADPAAEIPACCLACNATIHAASSAGERQIAADDFFLGLYETALRDNEIITSVTFARPSDGVVWAFEEFTRRHGDYAMAGLALTARSTDPVTDPRIVYFGISDRPVRAQAAETALDGSALDADVIRSAGEKAADGCELSPDPNAGEAMKAHLARTLLTRALTGLAEEGQ